MWVDSFGWVDWGRIGGDDSCANGGGCLCDADEGL
jgi:hypothetical protein